MSYQMPWSRASRNPKQSTIKNDASLDDILPTSALRTELVLLVVLCTDSMRSNLTQTFEIQDSASRTTGGTISAAKKLSLLDLDDDDSTQPSVSQPRSVRSDQIQIRNLAVSSSEMQDLKTSAVDYLNSWRTSVLRRLGETLKVQPETIRRAKASYLANREAEIKKRQYQDYLNWTEGEGVPSRAEEGNSSMNKPSSISTGRAPAARLSYFHTKLNDLSSETRALILNAMLFILVSLERYPAHSRILLSCIVSSLDLPEDILTSAETTLAITLQQSTHPTSHQDTSNAQNLSSTSSYQAQPPSSADSRWKVGFATIAGATLIGVTGGLAAPFLLGTAGAIMGGVGLGGLATLLGATIANPVTVAALFGALGGSTARNAMEEFSKEIADFEILPVKPAILFDGDKTAGEPDNPEADEYAKPEAHLRVVIGVSGHLLSSDDISHPWEIFSRNSYVPFALRYEYNALYTFGSDLNGILRGSGYALAQAGALQLALPVLSAAMLPVSLLKIRALIDNPFSIAMQRSDKAGVVLARALIAKVQGERPVTLVGFSLGARVIYSCLCELAKRKEFGIVESAVLIGAPVPSDAAAWMKMRTVVVDRLVNVFTINDIMLGYLYRVRYAQVGVAGLEAVSAVEGVENFDVTGMVKGHGQYRLAMGKVLKEINFEGLDSENVEVEERELEDEDRQEREVHERAKKEGALDGVEDEDGRIVMMDNTSDQEDVLDS